MNVVDYKVSNIKISGSITVDYTILLSNGMEKRLRVSSLETAHEDFYKALIDIKECFYQMIGFPIADAVTGEKLQVYVRKITFVNKTNCGRGMKITAAVDGIANHSDLTVLTYLFMKKEPVLLLLLLKMAQKIYFISSLRNSNLMLWRIWQRKRLLLRIITRKSSQHLKKLQKVTLLNKVV